MMRSSAELRLDLAREPHFDYLNPAKLSLFRDESGRLRLTVEDDRSYLDVRVVRAFPFSDPARFIGLLDGADKVIGLVEDPRELEDDSRALAEEALARHYFIPTIQRVVSLTEQYGVVYLDVETDRGPREFVAKGLRDAIADLGEGELLISDVDGNRYRIADWRQLDVRSRRFLDRVV